MKLPIILCLAILKLTSGHPKASQTCTSPECYRQSKSLLSKVDSTVSPCDDFYQFACGNYKDQGSPAHDHFIDIQEWIAELATEPFNDQDDKLVKLIKIFYQSCMNDRGSFDDFIEVGMNMRRRANPSGRDFSWEFAIHELQFYQNTDAYLFSTRMGYVDDLVLLTVDQPMFETKAGFMDRESEEVKDFYANLVEFLVYIGIDRKEVEKMQDKAFAFEDELLALVDDKSEAQIEVSSIAELQHIFKFINWTVYIQNFFNGSDVEIDDDFIVGVRNQDVLMKIDEFLFASTDDEILNYLVWRFFESAFIELVYESEDEESIEKFSFITSNPNFNRRSGCTSCVCKLISKLDVAVAAVYARHNVNQQDQKKITEMIKSMKSQLFDTFDSIDWLDSKTRTAATRKLSKMKFYVGYPDLLLNEEFLSEFYAGLDISGRSLVQINDQIARHKNQIQRKFLVDQTVDPDTSETLFLLFNVHHIIEPNAFYSPYFNTFIICAGFIYSDTFSVERPQALNFGATGYAIGHEIFHGFDNSGRHFDENGKQKNWWQKETEKKFEDKSMCFVDQYGKYVEPISGMNVNGVNTLGENIADNGGVFLAYNTFQKFRKLDQILPNANFTSNQLLWLSMAQQHCSNKNYPEMIHHIKNDPHSPGRFRVIGTLGNLKEFSKDFQCPKGSMMNRKNKCKIW